MQLNTPTRPPSPLGGERAVSVSAGGYHSLALTGSGAIWSWGQGGLGQLGHGDHEHQWQPTKIEALTGQRVVAVSSGREHSLALTGDGDVWSWGLGGDGRVGHGDGQSQLLPKKIEALAGQRVVALSAGGGHKRGAPAPASSWPSSRAPAAQGAEAHSAQPSRST